MVSSRSLLGRVLDDLKARYPNTRVRRDAQAAALSFAGGATSLDVVPAIFRGFHQSRPVYLIPDGQGQWFETSPETHDQFFQLADKRSGGKLKRTSQLVKWWKHSREQSIPLSSFHTDLLLASSQICEGMKPYGQILYEFFLLLSRRQGRGLQDPCGVAGIVGACATNTQMGALLNCAQYAAEHSFAALVAEKEGRYMEANRQWNIVFNGEF